MSSLNFDILCFTDIKYRLVYCPKCHKTQDYVARKISCTKCKTAFMYQCGKCMKLYKSNDYLKKHLFYDCNNKESKFICDHCQFKTNRKYILTKHIKVRHLPRDPNSNKCSKCRKCYSSKSGLWNHLKTCHQPKNATQSSELKYLSCDFCNHKSATKQHLSKHIQAKHLPRDLNKNKCSKCPKIFLLESNLKEHSKFCGLTRDARNLLMHYSCNDCKFKTDSKSYLAKHIQAKHLPSNSYLNKCSKCKKSYSKKSILQRHFKVCQAKDSKYSSKLKSFICDNCNYKTHYKWSLSNHMQTKHLLANSNFNECSKCKKSFSWPQGLLRHFKSCGKPDNIFKQFCCDYCEYKTGYEFYLSIHIQAKHLPQDPNLNKCQKCGKSFSCQPYLRKHSKFCKSNDGNHSTPLKSFSGEGCKSETYVKINLSDHIRAKHLPRDTNLNERQICGNSFSTQSSLIKHSKICNSKDFNRSPKLKTFSCNDCNFKTVYKANLSVHIQGQHLPRDPNLNKCIKCQKTFSTRSYLRKHLKICKFINVNHSSLLKSFSCDYCKYKTPLKLKLSNHIQTKHLTHDSNFKKCNNCGKNFSSRSSLVGHFKMCEQTKRFLQVLRSLPARNQVDSNHRVLFERESTELWENYKRTLLLILSRLKKN